MKQFIWNIRCMISAKKYRHTHDNLEIQYQWYKYLVKCDIDNFFARFKFWRSIDSLPF